MANTFIVVESPAKARTISKYLQNGFVVKASMGHIRDLPENKIAVNVKKNFEPSFVILSDKKKIVKELLETAKKADKILLAADPDREGEAICYHLNEIFKETEKEVKRVLFFEVTEKAIKEAIKNPVSIDFLKVEAQFARRIIDRLVGYYISPLLWQKVKKGLSAGRVQTVALRMLCEREEEIENFISEEYYIIKAILQNNQNNEIEVKLSQFKGKKVEIKSRELCDEILENLKNKKWIVKKVTQKEAKKSPQPPFTTSKLQQEAARLYKFPVKKTMMIAQKLYEGVDLQSGERTGLITYMRTDSTRISPEALKMARDYISANFDKEYLPKKERVYSPKEGAQDAHEAIRPTAIFRTPESVRPFLKEEEYLLYKLIWKRFLASQMTDAIYLKTKVEVECGDALFQASGSICKFKGYRILYDVSDEESEESTIPELKENEELKLIELKSEQKWTEPPSRYTEATLVKALEENGIGRPSTYATIISTVQNREYAKKEGGYLVPTKLGREVLKILIKNFPTIFEINYTANLEAELDKIEKGEAKRLELLNKFWELFYKTYEQAKQNIKDVIKGIPTSEKCEKCGSVMVIKKKRNENELFLACSGYPNCENTKPLDKKEIQVDIDENDKKCPKCGNEMRLIIGQYGPFLACKNYPECKGTKSLIRNKSGKYVVKKEMILQEKCKICGSNLILKNGKYGPYTICSNSSKCPSNESKTKEKKISKTKKKQKL